MIPNRFQRKIWMDLSYRVRRIVQHQSKINSLKRKLPLYTKIMERLDHDFEHLRICHHLPGMSSRVHVCVCSQLSP